MKKLLMFLMFFVVAVAFAADKYSTWLDNEVKPIITKAEKDAFKKLKTDAEKDKFIEDFWAHRDPTPATPDNEYRKNYEDQLKIVMDKMKGSKKNPVDADMAMTVLIMGGGYEVKQEEAKGDEMPKQTWTYRHFPPGLDLGVAEFSFVGDPDEGGFKFQNSKKAHEVLDQAREYYSHLSDRAASMQAEEKAKMEAAMAAAEAMPNINSPEVKAALDAAVAGTPATGIAISALADSFMSSTGDVFGTFAISSPADVSAAKVGIRIVKADGTVFKEGEYPFTSSEEAPGHFQTGTPIKPGDYTTYFAVVAGDKSGNAKQAFKVPDYGAGFNMSSLILAKAFKQLDTPKPEKEPYTFGKIKIEPSADRIFTKADDLVIAYEAYGFQMDAGATEPGLEVVYTFQREGDSAKSTPPQAPHGLVTGKRMTIPTDFPLEKFPTGNYKLTLKLTDKGSGKTASTEASFTIK